MFKSAAAVFATGVVTIASGLAATAAAAAPVPSQSVTYHCSVLPQTFDVPAGVTSVAYTAEGGAGGDGGAASPGAGGNGDVSTGSIAVQPGQALTILVGCNGEDAGFEEPGRGGSGYADGGDGGARDPGSKPGGGGGGATAIVRQNVPVVVIGGGGGGGAGGFLASYGGGNGGSRTNGTGGDGGGPGAGAGNVCCAQPIGSGGEGGRGVAWGGGGGGGGGGFAGGFGADGGGFGAGGGGGGGRGSTHVDGSAVTVGDNAPIVSTAAGYVTLTVTNADAGSVPVMAHCNNGIVHGYTVPTGATALSVTAIGASGGSEVDASGGNGAGADAEVAVHAGQTIFYAVGCHGQSPPQDGQNGGYSDTTNAAGAGGAGYASGGAGGLGERAQGTFPPDGPRGGAGGGGSSGLLAGSTLELIAAGGGGAGGGGADVEVLGGGKTGGAGGDAAGAAGTGSAGSPGDAGGPFGTPPGAGGGLGTQLGNGSGGAGQFNPFTGQLNGGGGGGGAGAPNAGGGGGGTGTGNSDYGASAGGGGGARSFTGGADVKGATFFDTSDWRAEGDAGTSNPARVDQDGLIVITPVFCQCSPPTLTVTAPDGTVGIAYTGHVVTGGSPTPSVSVTSGSMPPGLHLDTGATGNIVGTPTKGGTYAFDLTADNGISPRATVHVVITVAAPPAVSGTPVPGAVNSPYGPYTFQRSGTPLPTITVDSGSFPPGLSLSSAGRITGTPTTAGTFNFRIKASNGNTFPPDIEDEQIVISAVGPSAPTSVHATAGVESATVTWTAPSSNGGSQVLQYTIVATDLTHPANGPVTTTVTGGPPATTTVVHGLTAGDQWVFTVTATNVDQLNSPESAPSNPVVPLAATACTGDSAHIAPGATVTITFSCTGPGLTYARNGSIPFHGSLSAISGNQITYTADPGFSGIDSFQVQASGPGGTATDSITIFIGAQAQTTPASDVTRTSATLNGWVQSPSDHVAYSFQWGTDTNYSHTTPTHTANSAGGDRIFVHETISGLTAGVVYHYRIHAVDPSTGNDEFGSDHLVLALPPHSVEINEVKFGELADFHAFGDDYVDIYNGSGVAVNLGNFILREARSRNDFGYAESLNNVTLQPRQHYLMAHGGYRLGSYAAPDQALNSQTVGETTAFQLVGPGATVFDNVGYAGEPYVDGKGLPQLLNFNNASPPQIAFVRRFRAGEPVNTADNAADFLLVTSNGNTYSAGGVLGSPAPLDVASPSQVNAIAQSYLYNPSVGQGAAPNFQYIPPASGDVSTSNPGTMIVRRTVTNVSPSLAITRLQLHITGLSTFGMQFDPSYGQPSNPSAMAIIEDVNATAAQAGAGVTPTTVNSVAHGMNSTLTIPLPALAGSPTGKGLAPGQSMSFALVFHVYSHGRYAFAYNLEDDVHAYQPPKAKKSAAAARTSAAAKTRAGAASAVPAGGAPVIAGGLRGDIVASRGRVTSRITAGATVAKALLEAFARRARSARAPQHTITDRTRGHNAP